MTLLSRKFCHLTQSGLHVLKSVPHVMVLTGPATFGGFPGPATVGARLPSSTRGWLLSPRSKFRSRGRAT